MKSTFNLSVLPPHKFHPVKIFILLLPILFISCKSNSFIEKKDLPLEYPYIIQDHPDFSDIEKPYEYFFIRLYNAKYKNPLYIANILQFGIQATEVNDISVSHAAFNFSLNDDFWGLSLNGGNDNLAQETCTDTSTNGYMSNVDPDKAEQITYAIRLSKEEYTNLKNFLDEYIKKSEIRYDPFINFSIAGFSIRRKFFTPRNMQLFGNITYLNEPKKDRQEFDPEYTKNDFVCSTFIAYALNKNVASINQYFNEHNINYRFVNVSDIPEIPGVVKLFNSTWSEYLNSANAFVEENPEFKKYLKQ